jgi:Zn-dependent protease
MPLILYLTAGFIFGGAKPVPVNPYLFKNMRKGMAITGIAGPLVNITIALVAGLILRMSEGLGGVLPDAFVYIFAAVGMWNIVLAAFNLVPIPPLDGSRVAVFLMPREWAYQYEKLERFGLLLVIVVFMTGVLDPVFDYAFRAFIFLAGSDWLLVYDRFS